MPLNVNRGDAVRPQNVNRGDGIHPARGPLIGSCTPSSRPAMPLVRDAQDQPEATTVETQKRDVSIIQIALFDFLVFEERTGALADKISERACPRPSPGHKSTRTT